MSARPPRRRASCVFAGVPDSPAAQRHRHERCARWLACTSGRPLPSWQVQGSRRLLLLADQEPMETDLPEGPTGNLWLDAYGEWLLTPVGQVVEPNLDLLADDVIGKRATPEGWIACYALANGVWPWTEAGGNMGNLLSQIVVVLPWHRDPDGIKASLEEAAESLCRALR